jgi:hypothetical protein
MATTLHPDSDTSAVAPTQALPGNTVTAVIAGIAAAWVAAGSAGMMAAPLGHALVWLALAAAILAGWPPRRPSAGDWVFLAAAVLGGIVMTAAPAAPLDVLAVALVLAALARISSGVAGRAMLLAALAVAVLGIFRLAEGSIPLVWLSAAALGQGLGWLAGRLTGRPLWIGSSFGGIDYLVLMTVLAVGWLASTPPPRRARAMGVAAAILLGHLAYLVLLACCPAIVAALPEVVPPPQSDISHLGLWAWGNAVRTLLPWNLPAVALLIHATIAGVIFRRGPWIAVIEGPSQRLAEEAEATGTRALVLDALLRFGPGVLAVLLPIVTMLAMGPSDLKDRTIVAYDAPGLDWSNPPSGRQTARTAYSFGMLPALVEDFGGHLRHSAELSAHDLKGADVLLLLTRPAGEHLSPAQLERVWNFVRSGGSLLVAAAPETQPGATQKLLNPLLAPTAMSLGDDTAVPAAKNWEEVCQAMPQPAAAGVNARQNGCGLVQPVMLRASWPANPLWIGRWAWGSSGGDAVRPSDPQYAAGDALGDLVLAARERVGSGRIVVFGDASCFSNDRLPASYPFAVRTLACLADKSPSPQDGWRQALGLLIAAALVGLLIVRAAALRIAVAVVALAVSLACVAERNASTAAVLPDGRRHTPNNLAYIDSSHLEAYSGDPCQENGIGEFCRVLVGNGYLPLRLPAVDAEHLERAAMLVSIAPAREFSDAERKAVHEFVSHGGLLISMVGAEDVEASRQLLADFQLRVPAMPVPPSENIPETEPLGGDLMPMFIDTPGHEAHVRFHAAWPVEGENAMPLVTWIDGQLQKPVVLSRGLDSGVVVLIGDSCFAMNKNLAEDPGTPQNADFWRWLLLGVVKHTDWTPPAEPIEGGLLDGGRESQGER